MRNKLISSFAGTACSFAASGLAFGADIAVKAATPSPAAVYNWTGFYVGGNIGASFGTFKTDFNAPFTATESVVNIGTVATVTSGFAGRDEVYPAGFIGGGQIGYNWQFSPLWVVGLEADFQGVDEKEHSTLTGNPTVVPGASSVGPTVLNYQTKIDWFGTVRGRLGYVWGNGDVMSYVTGGLAYGKVDVEGTSTIGAGDFNPFSVTQAFGHSHVNTGWAAGTGTEGKLLIPGWTYKIEGLYMDLGHLDATGPGASSSLSMLGRTFSVTAGPVTTHTHFTDAIIRVGLNYQFH
jgi:outer membrane immunogenic protein